MIETAEKAPPLRPREAAKMLNVSIATVHRLAGLEWLTWQASGKRTIKRITAESVRRLLEGER